jgi:uncharacterized protein (TIRG00374 family)
MMKNIVMDKKKISSISLLSLLSSIILIAVLLNYADISQFSVIFEKLDYKFYLTAFFIYISINMIIAYRLCYFFKINYREGFKSSFDVGACHAIALCILPLRLGDALYPFLVKNFLNKSLASSIHNLIVLRVYDFVSAAMLFISLLIFSVMLPEASNVAYLMLMVTVLLSHALLKNLDKILMYLVSVASKYKLVKIQKKIESVLIEINENASKISGKNHSYLFAFSLFRWVLSGLLLLYICRALNIEFQFEQTLYLTTGMNMAFIIPLQTVGGIGLLESVLAFLLSLLGLSIEEASVTAISIRFLWFLMPFILGAIWFSGRKLFRILH